MALSDNTTLDGAEPPRRSRRLAVDIFRGLAVVAMVIYHSAWDLSELALIETDIRASLSWGLFARAVAATFLVLAGIGLVLAHGRSVKRRAFLRRLAVVGAAAAAITLVTWFVFPDSYIYFGILHNIALSSLLALPFVGLPWFVTAIGAACFLAGPLVAGPFFDAPLLAFLGLGTQIPVTNDYVPVFPWTGFVLAGVAAAWLGRPYLDRTDTGPAPGRIRRALAAAGRHSLAIYLLHQPLIFGSLLALREVIGPSPAAEAAPFMRSCIPACQSAGQGAETCRASCACTVEELKRDGLWTAVLAGRPNAEESSRASALARVCQKRNP
ncbi:heparan-alpha-glucosaminide N-acetyltransferase [uncultured Enterovirga sp.]|uniref:heparan-alpha-glucosaminide N-acetyltransferase n=1 Tax=uncultured Enterovirga sp. TaxID=2026352 RepID=UPI0035CA1D46